MKVSKNYIRLLIKEQLESSLGEELEPYQKSNDSGVLDLNNNIEESFSVIEFQNSIKDSEEKIEELKSINEEIKRMKQLIDFRSPLLSKDNL